MRKSFGMIVLVIVMAVVLLLAASAWKRFGPAAIEVNGGVATVQPVDDHGETEAGQALRSGRLPRLQDAQARTDAHAGDVKQALQSAE